MTQWGYSKNKLAPVAWEMADQQVGGPVAASPETERRIDEEVKELVARAYAKCKATLTANRELLDELTEALIETETVDFLQLYDMVATYNPKIKELPAYVEAAKTDAEMKASPEAAP